MDELYSVLYEFQHLFKNAAEMSAFTIENATTENLPIYYLN
jgi:hypothetical protein